MLTWNPLTELGIKFSVPNNTKGGWENEIVDTANNSGKLLYNKNQTITKKHLTTNMYEKVLENVIDSAQYQVWL